MKSRQEITDLLGGIVEVKDKEYEDLVKAERKAARRKKKNHYHHVVPACCATCNKSSRMSIEGDLACSEIADESWCVNNVDPLGLCDKYVPRYTLGGRKPCN